MKPKWKAFERFLVFLLVFLIPTQLAYHFWPDSSLVFGIRIDYLAPAIYLTDLLIISLLGIWAYRKRGSIFQKLVKFKTPVLIVFSFILLNIVLSVSPETSFFRWLKITEVFMLFIYLRSEREIFKNNLIEKTFFYSLIVFSLIGIAHFLLGRTLGGPLYFLGERNFSVSTPGIALTQIGGKEFMRAYSTFSHPNSLAGYIGSVFLLLLTNQFFKKTSFHYLGFLTIIACLLLTFSLSSFLAFGVSLVLILLNRREKTLLYFNRIILFILIGLSLLISFRGGGILGTFKNLDTNISERINLSIVSGEIIKGNFLAGSGLGTFIIRIPEYAGSVTNQWLLQPVHNIFLLVFSEVGFLGLLFLALIFYQGFKTKHFLIFLFIALTGTLDHYWFTLQQNLLLLALIFGILI